MSSPAAVTITSFLRPLKKMFPSSSISPRSPVRSQPPSSSVRDGSARTLEDGGWLRTGDLGEMDDEGNIFFKGRKKDVIVTAAGLDIYPEDSEARPNRQQSGTA